MERIKKSAAVLCTAGLLLSGCASPAQPSGEEIPAEEHGETEPFVFTDDLGRTVEVHSWQRTAAMIGSFADIWCLAGGKEYLVAAASDTWTSFDLGLSDEVVNIGSSKDPNVELLLSAQPDLILASSSTSADMELLDMFEKSGIATAYFDVANFDDYLRMLEACTQITGCEDNYRKYGLDIQEQVDRAVARQDGSSPTVLYIRASGSSCSVKGSEGSVLGEMLADFGCVNIADSDSSLLEELSLEKILADDPDYIFVVLQGADTSKAEEALNETVLSNPIWQELTAVKEGRLYYMEHSLYNLKPNVQWGAAYEKLADILYPEQ